MALRSEERNRVGPCLGVIESPAIDPVIELPLMQRLALLGLMNSTMARGVAKRVSSAEQCQDRPSLPDYRGLVELGFAAKPIGELYHDITDEGLSAARKLLTALCRQYDIHVMTDTQGEGVTRYRCSCEQWSTVLYGKSGTHQWRRAMNSFYRHVPGSRNSDPETS